MGMAGISIDASVGNPVETSSSIVEAEYPVGAAVTVTVVVYEV